MSETVPLIPDNRSSDDDLEDAGGGSAEGKSALLQRALPLLARLGLPSNFADTSAMDSLKGAADSVVRTKERMRKSPWILSIIVCVAAFGILWAGLFRIVMHLLLFRPVAAVLKVYQVLFAVVCLMIELARYATVFGIRSGLRRWAPILELNIGRGCMQILTGGLAIEPDVGMIEWVPGMVLAVAGIFNCVWGIRCALRLRCLMDSFEKEMNQSVHQQGDKEKLSSASANNADGPLSAADTLRCLRIKFKALDINGDGFLTKDELASGCKALNLDLDETEIDDMFRVLDPKGKGHIDVTDFEAWWYREKDMIAAFLV